MSAQNESAIMDTAVRTGPLLQQVRPPSRCIACIRLLDLGHVKFGIVLVVGYSTENKAVLLP